MIRAFDEIFPDVSMTEEAYQEALSYYAIKDDPEF